MTSSSASEGLFDTLLQATGLAKTYGGVRALRDVDFDVRAGEVHALVERTVRVSPLSSR